MPTRPLPDEPSLEHLRNEAKALRRDVAARDAEAVSLARELHPRLDLDAFKLADAQLVVARRYGFPSWPRLRSHVETVPRREQPAVGRFLRLACLTYTADGPERLDEARSLLAADPELGRASIHTIAAVGDVAAAAELLARDPSQANLKGGPHGWEPLLYAAYSRLNSPEHSTLEVARLLLDHGADPNSGYVGEWGPPPFTALTGVFGYGEDAPNQPPHEYELELARLLIDAGADPNDVQALYNNMWRRSNEHLELLFAHGLGTGDGGPWRQRLAPNHPTPAQMLEEQLRFAADAGNVERVELLVRHGVDVNGLGMAHPILHGRNALELARANGHAQIAELLIEAGAAAPELDPVDELVAACMRGDRRRVDELVSADDELAVAAVARYPQRLLKAVEVDRPESVRLLVALGFDVSRPPNLLHLAAYLGKRAMVDLLLELGADPTLRDAEYDATPAGWARHAHHDELADHLAALETADDPAAL